MTDTSTPSSGGSAPEISVVVPVRNEAANILPLISEIEAALGPVASFEIVYVDDGSTDETLKILTRAMADHPCLRVFRHDPGCGQSQAIATGVRNARGPVIATLDGDGQNDPADIPALLAHWRKADAARRPRLMVAGWRANRQDTSSRRWASKMANAIRSAALGDATPDTGCGTKLFPKDLFLEFPRFNHMHRFLPALTIRAGGTVESVVVNHRPRREGRSNYGNLGRALVGLPDLLGVMWLMRRPSRPEAREIARP